MIVRVKCIKRVRSKGRIYYYDRQTGRRVTAPYGSPAFFEEINHLRDIAKVRPKIPGTLGGLIEAYRASPEFREQLAPRTRSDYQKVFNYLASIENMPIVQIDEAAVITFRDRAFMQRKRRFAKSCAFYSRGASREISCRAPSARSR